uniref:Uncharacterized protein n=1 Tax=Cucumis melo TaxID=3656 RepID=A0A9I9DIJ0_CUCME
MVHPRFHPLNDRNHPNAVRLHPRNPYLRALGRRSLSSQERKNLHSILALLDLIQRKLKDPREV